MEPTTTTASEALYSPRQIFWAAFFGGPVALTWLLARNFRGLGKPAEARQYRTVGLLGCLAIAAVLVLLPGKLSVGVFIGCAFAGQIISRDQHFGGSKVPPEGTPLRSNWRVFGDTVLALGTWLAVVIAIVLVLSAMGLKLPD
jgi:hypothetical protein